MQPWRRSAPDISMRSGAIENAARRRSPGVQRVALGIGLSLQRLGARISSGSGGPRPAPVQGAEHAGLARARAVLSEASQHLSGLVTASEPIVESAPPAMRALDVQGERLLMADAPSVPDLRLARVEDAILQLQTERQQLRSEISELRSIAESLRDSVEQFREQASAEFASPGTGHRSSWNPPEPVYAAGSIGVGLRVSAIGASSELDRLRAALAGLTEVDSIKLVRAGKRKARLRVYLRLPVARRQFVALVRQIAPAAMVEANSARSVSLRLHPS
jgi:hypothetical protein